MTARDARILVVGGAGTMGSSTALELARRGYTNVHILDIFPPPSANSAGNDMNKMISTQYVDGIWGRLAFEAWDAWKQDPLFAPFLHATGRVDLASADNITRLKSLRKQLDLSVSAGRPDNVQWLDSVADILAKAPYLRDGSIDGWKGLWVKDAGWMAAREALNAVGVEAKHLGVKGTFGPTGTFKSLLLGPDGKQCVGVETIDGTKWPADLVILATGAWSPTLIDLEGQCESKCWQFGHIQLTPEETAAFQNTPAMYNGGLGFFMEPSPQGIMKIVNEFEGYTRIAPCRPYGCSEVVTMSVPRSHALHQTDTIPSEGLDAVGKVIATCLPAFVGRPIFDTAICWCTDSFDGNWLLCEHPRYPNLILATGDSGHTFKMLPIVGGYVADLIEGKLSTADRDLWRWRPERERKVDGARDGPVPKDLGDLSGWCHD